MAEMHSPDPRPLRFAFAHIRNTPNTGDQKCTPFPYFDFPSSAVFNLDDEIPPCHAVIFGGGAIEPRLRNDGLHRKVDAKYRIAWGIGTSRSGSKDHGPLVEDLDLCGVRETTRQGGVFVPCASCMDPAFDKDYTIEHSVVAYLHAVKGLAHPIENLPTANNRTPFEEAIAFLGSGETVVTNSFHGVYWATLLGRKVVCLPFSSKFYGYLHPPTYARSENWLSVLPTAKAWPTALEDCRSLNRAFYRRVMALTSGS